MGDACKGGRCGRGWGVQHSKTGRSLCPAGQAGGQRHSGARSKPSTPTLSMEQAGAPDTASCWAYATYSAMRMVEVRSDRLSAGLRPARGASSSHGSACCSRALQR